MSRKAILKKNLKRVYESFPEDSDSTLVVVTKKSPLEDIRLCYELGERDFGENRVEDLRVKAEALSQEGLDDINWHFIGHLQSNKINKLLKVKGLKAIHSIDSFKLLQALFEREQYLVDRSLDFFIQINTSNEEEKFGLTDWDELAQVANFYSNHESKRMIWKGLMTMSKLRTEDFDSDAKKCFGKLVSIRDTLENDFGIRELELSMGMSSDYHLALPLGSDYIRLGSTIFAQE